MAELPRDDKNGSNAIGMSFWEHLDELRSRLIKALLLVAAAFCVVYFFAPQMQSFVLEKFFPPGQKPLAFLAPTEGFLVRIKLAFVGGLFLASPGVFYQFWSFVAPGLYLKEKRFILPIVFISSISFLVGAAFSFFVLPYATDFFLSFGGEDIQNTWSFGSYVTFVVQFVLAFGVVFELPMVIYFLVRLGIVSPEFLRKKRRHAIVVLLIIAAIITPPDVFTQLSVAIPLVILYEVSIIVATITYKKRQT
ncbi:MAG: twin-arginine translocase subunit TatC [bacterium]|nr:twin-arginine translocase subunit TatC [bacterium]